ncbi:MAG: antitoxin [Mogibacterium sp.]|nr:antitoxin [Mogibacterium sp.]
MLSLRMSDEDERLIRNFARYNQLTVSEFLRMAALERIENEYDLQILREYENLKEAGELKLYGHEEVWEDQ